MSDRKNKLFGCARAVLVPTRGEGLIHFRDAFVCLKVHSEGEIADCPVAVRGVQDTNGAGIRGREASFLAWRGDHYLSTLVFGRGAH